MQARISAGINLKIYLTLKRIAMLPIIGLIVVFGAIAAGYTMEEGNFSILIQPAELITIGGAALGSLIVSCPSNLLKDVFKSIPAIIKGSTLKKSHYIALLTLLYNIFTKIKKEGLLSIEKDVENPKESAIFQANKFIMKNHHALDFLCDNLRVFIIGIKPTEMEDLMDIEMDSHHEEAGVTPGIITKVGDALPGFGIVAAVLGIVITMGKMSDGPEVIGHSVAAALVGTFLGILLSYGVVGPLGSHLEHKNRDDSKYIEAIKIALLAFAKDLPPQMAVEAGRRTVFSGARPSFKDLEDAIKDQKKK